MDDLDKKLLDVLQQDSTIPVAELAKRVGLSTTPCWRRIRKLEERGIIRRRVALVDPEGVNLKTTVFVLLRTSSHTAAWFQRLTDIVSRIDEVVGFYRLAGDVDYLLQIVVPDIAGYDAVYKRLVAAAEFTDVSASFVMETIKSTTALPLTYVAED